MSDKDTVYRRDVIDIVTFECNKWEGLAKEIAKQINALPSAEPEMTFEQLKEYCRKRCLSVVTNEFMEDIRKMVPPVWVDMPSAEPEKRTEKRTETHACDCINRQKAIEKQESAREYCADCNHIEMCQWYPFEGCDFRSLPSAQSERKKGKWLRYGEDGYPNNEDTVFWQCDQCLEQYTGRTKRIPNFCPNCGADMRGEAE